ncbi:MAG: ABC transporter permease [Dehalococcoidia bacterium]
MQRYIVRRLLLIIPTVVGVSILVFLLVRMLPGDILTEIAAEFGLTPEEETRLRAEYGLDRPIYTQYFAWMGEVVRGDLGESLLTRRPVLHDLGRRLVPTVELGAIALVVSLAVAIPIGVLAALKQDTIADYAARGGAILFLSIPSFWLAVLILVVGAIWFGWAPPARYVPLWEDPASNLKLMVIPALVLGTYGTGGVMRLMRGQMLEVMRQDYIRTARAKGLRERLVVLRHAVKNAFIPVITYIGFMIPMYLSATVVVEWVFAVPGVGRFLIESVQNRDYTVIQGVNLIIALVVAFSNLAVDISYSYLDPRVRYQ